MKGANETGLPAVLTFEDTEIRIIDRDGRPWVTAADLARALGYAREDAISRLYERNADEFTDALSLTVNLTVKGFGAGNSEKPVRIFSARGCHLVAMLARTAQSKAFRRWVLDVLDALAAGRPAAGRRATLSEPAPPQPAPRILRLRCDAARPDILGASPWVPIDLDCPRLEPGAPAAVIHPLFGSVVVRRLAAPWTAADNPQRTGLAHFPGPEHEGRGAVVQVAVLGAVIAEGPDRR